MKIAVLEDRPWVLWGFVEKMKEMGVDQIIIIYYHSSKTYNQGKDEEILENCNKRGVELRHIEDLKFDEQMDAFYVDPETVFFFDLDINDKSDCFEERINVRYAKQKWKNGDCRIWFYTTSGAYNVDRINKEFNDHCIPAIRFDQKKNIVIFDYNYIEQEILNR